jgi:hypothetical protein
VLALVFRSLAEPSNEDSLPLCVNLGVVTLLFWLYNMLDAFVIVDRARRKCALIA